jgi:hypothetical protein
MWRSLITAWIIYGCGHPSFDAYRPAVLDRPLQLFYETVNSAARDGKKAIAAVDESRLMRHVKDYVAATDARLRASIARSGTAPASLP